MRQILFEQRLTYTQMTPLNLAIDKSLIQVPVTTVQPPQLRFGDSPSDPRDRRRPNNTKTPHDGDWNLTATRFIQAPTITGMRCFRIVDRDHNGFKEFENPSRHIFEALHEAFGIHYGIPLPGRAEPDVLFNVRPKPGQKRSEAWMVDHLFAGFGRNMSSERRKALYIVILESEDAAIFAAVKRAADAHGLHTICVQKSKVDGHGKRGPNPDGQYTSNLCLKINAKWARDVHHVRTFETNKLNDTIVLGADIGSSKGGPLGTTRIAAVVGSIDRFFMNMPGSIRPIAAKSDVSGVRS